MVWGRIGVSGIPNSKIRSGTELINDNQYGQASHLIL
jgi:hypothetical protein